MSRLARYPLTVPAGVQVSYSNSLFRAQKSSTALEVAVPGNIEVEISGSEVRVSPDDNTNQRDPIVGTTFALIRNTLVGLDQGYEKRLLLQGVGYRANQKGQSLELSVGYSHPVVYEVPAAVELSVPSATEIILKSVDKQLVGQVAAEIRAIRKPDPYKGKGVRYADEQLKLKEVSKKK